MGDNFLWWLDSVNLFYFNCKREIFSVVCHMHCRTLCKSVELMDGHRVQRGGYRK